MGEEFRKYSFTHKVDAGIKFEGFVSTFEGLNTESENFVVYPAPSRSANPYFYIYDASDWNIVEAAPSVADILQDLEQGSLVKDDGHVPFFKSEAGWVHVFDVDTRLSDDYIAARFNGETFVVLYNAGEDKSW